MKKLSEPIFLSHEEKYHQIAVDQVEKLKIEQDQLKTEENSLMKQLNEVEKILEETKA